MKNEVKKHYFFMLGGHMVGTAFTTPNEAKAFNENPENKQKKQWLVENFHANLPKMERHVHEH